MVASYEGGIVAPDRPADATPYHGSSRGVISPTRPKRRRRQKRLAALPREVILQAGQRLWAAGGGRCYPRCTVRRFGRGTHGEVKRVRVVRDADLREPVLTLDSRTVRCVSSVAQESITEMPNKIPGTSVWLGSFLQIGHWVMP
jgi:hypothetical protein